MGIFLVNLISVVLCVLCVAMCRRDDSMMWAFNAALSGFSTGMYFASYVLAVH